MDWKKESEMFNQMVDYYDKYRPDYPKEIINAIIQKANLAVGSKILEIGAGSGKATAQFVDFGFDMLCIDSGADLVKKGNEKFKEKNIKFIASRFENYSAPLNYFDAIISAQAFHWVSKSDGYEKCAKILKHGGYLAPFWNIEIVRDTDFDKELLAILQKYNAFTASVSEDDYKKRMESISSEITDSGFFMPPEIIHSHWDKNYTADEYYGFVLTGNVFVQNSDDMKQACQKEFIKLAEKYNGINRHYISELYLTKKL